jgi:hypothetical protein
MWAHVWECSPSRSEMTTMPENLVAATRLDQFARQTAISPDDLLRRLLRTLRET